MRGCIGVKLFTTLYHGRPHSFHRSWEMIELIVL